MLRGSIISCYFIVSIIQSRYIHMPLETEKRLHQLCPSVSVHIVNGQNTSYDGVVETLLNRLPGQHDEDWDTCIEYEEEDKILNKVGLSCESIKRI